MLIEGNLRTNKIDLLVEKYSKWLNNGVNAEEILVLCSTSYKKNYFIEKLKENPQIQVLENPKIYTFLGLCYHTISDNWPIIEENIKYGKTKVSPNLCGLEVSQYIFKESIKIAGFKDYNSKVNLLHQLFKRYTLIAHNNLSKNDIETKSKILKETFNEDCQSAIDNYKLMTLEKRSFDYLRQLSVFNYLYKEINYFDKIKYLIVDDADEITFANWEFIKHLKPKLKDFIITYDKNGGSRCGYLSAYKSGVEEFCNLTNEKPIILTKDDDISKNSEQLYNNITNDKKSHFDNVKISTYLKRLDMLEHLFQEIKTLVKKGVNASDICIITPVVDDLLKFSLTELFEELKLKYQILSGSEKLYENKAVKNAILILKLSNKSWGLNVEEIEIRSLLSDALKIPLKHCFPLLSKFNSNKELQPCEFQNKAYTEKYSKLLNTIQNLQSEQKSLSNQLFAIYNELLKGSMNIEDTKKFNFLCKQVEDFEAAFENENEITKKEFIFQLENSIVSENPSQSEKIQKNSIIVSTPQKIIDYETKTKYHFWLDSSNQEWQKNDTGTLYNAWVFNAEWKQEEFTYEDSIKLMKEKTARILRKLMLCCDKEIQILSSLYDAKGNENFGGISDFFSTQTKNEDKPQKFQITPREDQKPVLNYLKGKMGIMAVPGAGKTTILLALIIKLLNMKIDSQNIFVLTYMEAAARNFKERIKLSCPDKTELPNISTIHGLALRIIKENSNYSKLGLAENFEICDETQKQKIIRETLHKLKLDQENYENYEKAISVVKLNAERFNLKSKYKEINDFIKFFNNYNKAMAENNLIDYDDMLFLCIKLLEENPEILEYYQNICQYIIEDEAQDSSSLQQKLIQLLARKHQNVIRCGDINQSITSTFANSDVKNFKDFLLKNKKVEMNSSQRCAEPVYSLANKIVVNAINDENKEAFYKIKMTPTEKNPTSIKGVDYQEFGTDQEEKQFIIRELGQLTQKHPNSSFAILLRNNFQVKEYLAELTRNGFKPITRTDSLGDKNVFKIIFSTLKFVHSPWNNKELLNFALTLKETEKIKVETDIETKIKELKKPFITLTPDEAEEMGLSQIHADSIYWLENSTLSFDNLATKIGLYYNSSVTDKSNVYLISMLIKKLMSTFKTTETILEKMESISSRPIMSSFKLFEDNEPENSIKSKINIMTVHKSKGDEFDFVFMPGVNEINYSTTLESSKVKANTHFIEAIKNIDVKYKIKTKDELKISQIQENLRLLYVGVTRAKKDLYITTASKNHKKQSAKPCQYIKKILEGVNE